MDHHNTDTDRGILVCKTLVEGDDVNISLNPQELSALIEACNVAHNHPTEGRPPWRGRPDGRNAYKKLLQVEKDLAIIANMVIS